MVVWKAVATSKQDRSSQERAGDVLGGALSGGDRIVRHDMAGKSLLW